MNSRHFTLAEFLCKCGRVECDAPRDPSEELVRRLDVFRERLGLPVVIASGIRCVYWNHHEGGVAKSGHLTAHEVDLACPDSRARWNMFKAIYLSGAPLFPRIGIGKSFLHVGVSPDLDRQVVWTYYA